MRTVEPFLFLICIFSECHGMSRDFFGMDSNPDDCTSVQNELAICSEELAELRTTGQCRDPRVVRQRSACDAHLKRFINLLLSSVSLKNRHLIDGESVSVVINLTFTSETLGIFKSFSRDHPHDYSWMQLDQSFVTLLEKVESVRTETFDGPGFSDGDSTGGTSSPTNPILVIVGIVGTLMAVILYLILIDQSTSKVVFVGFVLIFALSLSWTWHLEVRKETDQGLMTLRKSTVVPDYCFQSNDGWWSQIVEAVTGSKEESCKKYHEALMYEPWTRVSFVKVFTKTISGLFLESLPLFGEKMGQMISNMNRELGFIPSIFGGLTTALILPPLFIVCIAFFFTNAFTSSLWALLRPSGRPSHSSPPPEPALPGPQHNPPITSGETQPPVQIISRQYVYRDIHKHAKKKVSIKYRPKLKLLRSISSPTFHEQAE